VRQAGQGREWWGLAPPLTLLAAALFGVTACAPRSGRPPRRQVVEISGMAFQPAVLELERGDTVIWINRDLVPHTATAERAPAWTTGQIGKDESGRFVARAAGEIPYICQLHPVMKGRLIVR
jgi:plastocyanin